MYIKHVYNGIVAETFLEDALFGANKTITVEERVDIAATHVQNVTTTTKVAMGQIGLGGDTYGKRGGGRSGGFNNN